MSMHIVYTDITLVIFIAHPKLDTIVLDNTISATPLPLISIISLSHVNKAQHLQTRSSSYKTIIATNIQIRPPRLGLVVLCSPIDPLPSNEYIICVGNAVADCHLSRKGKYFDGNYII